jgi:hypothetical protein
MSNAIRGEVYSCHLNSFYDMPKRLRCLRNTQRRASTRGRASKRAAAQTLPPYTHPPIDDHLRISCSSASCDVCWRQDDKYFMKLKWQFMILDEAQAIKNAASQRWNVLLNLKCRNRLLLTGTPIQNNLSELWSLLHFIHVCCVLCSVRSWLLIDREEWRGERGGGCDG